MKQNLSLWRSVPPLLGFYYLWTDCLQFLEIFCSLFFCCLHYSKWHSICQHFFNFFIIFLLIMIFFININRCCTKTGWFSPSIIFNIPDKYQQVLYENSCWFSSCSKGSTDKYQQVLYENNNSVMIFSLALR